MYFANFNITFGKKEEPMLEYFEDAIFPAFTKGYFRGKEGEYPQYSFQNVSIKLIDNEYVLAGNYVKNTRYEVYTALKDGELIDARSDVPTAPYSRFIIFLKNHRMVLVKNEIGSPDIRSFQRTVRNILQQHCRKRRKLEGKKDFPSASVNIVDIPSKEQLQDQLKDVAKIERMKIRMFPLNNDLDATPILQDMRDTMNKLGCKTASTIMNSPNKKEGICGFVDSSSGLAEITLEVKESDGSKKKIKNHNFSTSKKIPIAENIAPHMDEYLVVQAKKDQAVLVQSPENVKTYESKKGVLDKLFDFLVEYGGEI